MVTAKNKSKIKFAPEVYSYLRFSTPRQKWGDSEDRQKEIFKLVEKFAKDKGIKFNETLCLADKGVSAFSGAHRKKGALGHFLEMVRKGQIAKGSYLAVENIDRLSRESVLEAIKTIIIGLIGNDISILTITFDENLNEKFVEYNKLNIDEKIGSLMDEIKRAHGESKRKSKVILSSRQIARELARAGKVKLTGRCPVWLEPVKGTYKDKKGEDKYGVVDFKVRDGAREAIEMIFDLKLKGLGKIKIAGKLNKEAAWKPPPNKRKKSKVNWTISYVQKILQNPAVIRVYQPHSYHKPVGEPILNYYPRVIDDNVFYAVQEQFKKNKGKGGRTGKANNLFVYLAKCAYCGGSMHYDNKGKPPKGRKYLYCSNGEDGDCANHRINYDVCEKLILENCRNLKPDEVLPKPAEQAKLCKLLRERIQGYIGQQKKLDKEKNILRASLRIITNPELIKECEDDFAKLMVQAKEIKTRQDEEEGELRKAESSLQSFANWKKDLTSLLKEIKKDNNAELRMRLCSHLREFIEKIEVYTVGFKEIYKQDKDKYQVHSGEVIRRKDRIERVKTSEIPYREVPAKGKFGAGIAIKGPTYYEKTETIKDELYDIVGEIDSKLVRTKLFRSFVKDVVQRRMSKEGRFLRIYFKTGVWFDLVPKGSIASGSEMYINEDGKKNWKFIRPSVDKLWNEYKIKGLKSK